MSNIGRRVVSKHEVPIAGCGGQGIRGTVVNEDPGECFNILFDNCRCGRGFNGGCDGFPADRTSYHFDWLDNEPRMCVEYAKDRAGL